MNKYIDLHTHSCCSDGADRPEEIARLAAELDLAAVALTDHDTVAGIDRFLAAAEAGGAEGIPGVEISTIYGSRELHIVGLFIDHRAPDLSRFLEAQRLERLERARRLAARLSELGYPVTMPELAGDTSQPIGRPHFARALAENYRFASIAEVFDKLLKRGCPAYVPRQLPPPEAAIEVIHAAGGVTVWAHPVSGTRNERNWLARMLTRLVPMGLDGIEAYYSSFAAEQNIEIVQAAARFGLAVSGGSDYHGSIQPHISLGVGGGGLRIPETLLDPLRARRLSVSEYSGAANG